MPKQAKVTHVIKVPSFTSYASIKEDIPEPEAPGFDFLGWSVAAYDGPQVSDEYLFKEPCTVYSRFAQKMVTITLDLGTEGNPITDIPNNRVTIPQNSTHEYLCKVLDSYKIDNLGFTLVNWSMSGEVIPNDYVYSVSTTIKAIWQELYIYLICSMPYDESKVMIRAGQMYGEIKDKLPSPYYPNHTLLGWVLSSNSEDLVTDDYIFRDTCILYAFFESLTPTYTHTFVYGDGHIETVKAKENSTLKEVLGMFTPYEREGYTLIGWNTKRNQDTPISEDIVLNASLNFYAICEVTIELYVINPLGDNVMMPNDFLGTYSLLEHHFVSEILSDPDVIRACNLPIDNALYNETGTTVVGNPKPGKLFIKLGGAYNTFTFDLAIMGLSDDDSEVITPWFDRFSITLPKFVSGRLLKELITNAIYNFVPVDHNNRPTGYVSMFDIKGVIVGDLRDMTNGNLPGYINFDQYPNDIFRTDKELNLTIVGRYKTSVLVKNKLVRNIFNPYFTYRDLARAIKANKLTMNGNDLEITNDFSKDGLCIARLNTLDKLV